MAELIVIQNYEQFSKNAYNFIDYKLIAGFYTYINSGMALANTKAHNKYAIQVQEGSYHILELNNISSEKQIYNELLEYIEENLL